LESDEPGPEGAADTPPAAAAPGKHRHHWFKQLHGQHQLSTVLHDLAAHQEASIPFGSMIDALGARAHGMALLILILPEAIPMPIPSVGAVLGIPLILVAAHLVVFGEHAGIPERVRSINMPVSALRAVVKYLGPVLDFLENLARPRWLVLARSERISGAVCLYLALLLFLPIPFLNFPQALCLAAIALGMVTRDGIFVAAGYIGTAILTGSLIVAAEILRRQFFG
jgi:hypothetical protein